MNDSVSVCVSIILNVWVCFGRKDISVEFQVEFSVLQSYKINGTKTTKLLRRIFCNYRAFEDRRSHYEPSVAGAAEVDDLDDHELYVPHFQRVSISGEDTSGVCICYPSNI